MMKIFNLHNALIIIISFAVSACSKVNFGDASVSSALSSSGLSQPLSDTNPNGNSTVTLLPPPIDLPPGAQFPDCFKQVNFMCDAASYINVSGPQNLNNDFINLIQNANDDVQVVAKELVQVNSIEGALEFKADQVGLISDIKKGVTGSTQCAVQIQNISSAVTISNEQSQIGQLGQIHNILGDVSLSNFDINNIHDIAGALSLSNSNVLELANISGNIALINSRVRYLHNVKGHVTLINSVVEQSDGSDLN